MAYKILTRIGDNREELTWYNYNIEKALDDPILVSSYNNEFYNLFNQLDIDTSIAYNPENTTKYECITSFIMSDTPPDSNTITIRLDTQEENRYPIYAWVDQNQEQKTNILFYTKGENILIQKYSKRLFSMMGNDVRNVNITVDFSKFKVQTSSDMTRAFSGIYIINADPNRISEWDFTNCRYLGYMFSGSTFQNPISLDLSNWNIVANHNATDGTLYYTFSGTKNLIGLNISNIDVSDSWSLNGAFSSSSLTTVIADNIVLYNDNNANNTYNMNGLFSNTSITDFNFLKNWDVRNITDIGGFFQNNTKVETIDLSSWNIGSNMESLRQLCYGCTLLKQISLSSDWDLSNCDDIALMFCDCDNLQSINGTAGWNTSNVTNFSNVFCCPNLQKLDISGWDFSNGENFNGFIKKCDNLEELNLTNIVLPNSNADIDNMIYNTYVKKSLKIICSEDVENWIENNRGLNGKLNLGISSGGSISYVRPN